MGIQDWTSNLTEDEVVACEDSRLPLCRTIDELSNDPRNLFVGVDFGCRADPTVAWVLADGDAMVTVAVFELEEASLQIQYDLLDRLLSLPCVHRCCIDTAAWGRQLAHEALERFGAKRVSLVSLTLAMKNQLMAETRISADAGRLRIPSSPCVRGDFVGAGDRFWAAALAVHAVGIGDGRAESVTVGPLQFARTGTW